MAGTHWVCSPDTGAFSCFSGNRNLNLLPAPGSLSTQILPPVRLDQPPGDSQAEPTARQHFLRLWQFEKLIENFLMEFRSNARARVRHRHSDRIRAPGGVCFLRFSKAHQCCPLRRSHRWGSALSQTVPPEGVNFAEFSSRLETMCCTLA